MPFYLAVGQNVSFENQTPFNTDMWHIQLKGGGEDKNVKKIKGRNCLTYFCERLSLATVKSAGYRSKSE